MGRLVSSLQRWVCLGPAIVLFFFAESSAQTFSSTRIEINRYVRDLMGQPLETYIQDSTLNRLIYYSHRTTMLALGEETDVDIDTVITSRGLQRYAFTGSTTEMRGEVSAVFRRVEENQGGGDVALVEIAPDQVGRTGEGVIPASYYSDGEFLVLGSKPLGSDTLFVHYKPLAADLTADGTSLSVSGEDFEAVASLTASKAFMREGRTDMGKFYFDLWQSTVALKKGQVK